MEVVVITHKGGQRSDGSVSKHISYLHFTALTDPMQMLTLLSLRPTQREDTSPVLFESFLTHQSNPETFIASRCRSTCLSTGKAYIRMISCAKNTH